MNAGPPNTAPTDFLLEAIQARFALSTELRALLPGGLWTGEVPEGSTAAPREMPYAALEYEGSDYENTFEDYYLERARFSATFYAAGAATCDAVMNAWERAFNWQDLPFRTAECLACRALHRRMKSEWARDKEGRLVFCGTIFYEATISRGSAA